MSERAPQSNERLHVPSAPERERPVEKNETLRETSEKLDKEEVKQEIAEIIKKAEKEAPSETHEGDKPAKPHLISPKQKDASFKRTMRDIQSGMPAPSKAFSKFIHNPAIENTSDVLGRTIARPTSILYGSVCAFAVMLSVYLLAKHNGFRLSGSEFIILFAIGWFIGLFADMIKSVVSRRS